MFRSSGGASVLLVVGTFFWGVTFVLIGESLKHVSVFTFIYWRFFIAFVVLGIIFFPTLKKINRQQLLLGSILGCFMGVSIFTQTEGLRYTTPSKSAFITGLSVVLVPLINGMFYTKKWPRVVEIVAVGIATIGIGMLTITEGFSGLNRGDFLTFLCAVAFAFYIIKVDHFSKKSNPIALTIIQIFFIACMGFFSALLVDGELRLPTHIDAWKAILFCAIPATAVMFTIQNYFQRYISPPLRVAIIFSLEPVFAAITEYVYTGHAMTTSGEVGATCIVFSMLLPEVFPSKKTRRTKRPPKEHNA